MEPKKFASLLEDDSLSFPGHDVLAYQTADAVFPPPPPPPPPPPSPPSLLRPQSPASSNRFSLRGTHTNDHSTSVSADCPITEASCVTQTTASLDCATQRFFVWAAIQRNASCRMTEDERLECALLHCTRRFQDHESMLRHLVTCEYLALGEYWCFDHMRVERFDDSRCKNCLGHPSKRRKMLSKAKSFFASLGHHKGKGVVHRNPLSSSSSSLASAALSDTAVARASSVGLGTGTGTSSACVGRSNSTGSNHSRGSCSSNRSRNSYSSNCSNRSNSNSIGSGSISTSTSSSCSARSNSYRRGDDSAGVPPLMPASMSAPTSSAVSPFPPAPTPPPRYEDINARMRAELSSTNEIVEIDSRELTEIPPSASHKPPAPSLATIVPTYEPYVNTTTTAAMPFAPLIVPTATSVTLPIPPPASRSFPLGFDGSYNLVGPSTGPLDLFLPELAAPTVSDPALMDWETAGSSLYAIPSTFDGITESNAVLFSPFAGIPSRPDALEDAASLTSLNMARPPLCLDTQCAQFNGQTPSMLPPPSLAPVPPPPRPARPAVTPAPRSKNLAPSSSVRSTLSTTSTASTASSASNASATSTTSNVSDASFLTNATSVVSSTDDCTPESEPWSASMDTHLTSPTDEFADWLNTDLFSGEQESSEDRLCPPMPPAPDLTMDLDATLFESPLSYPQISLDAAAIDASGTSTDPGLDEDKDDQCNNDGHGDNGGMNGDVPHDGSDSDPLPNDTEPLADAKAMVISAWELLLTHMTTSLAKLCDLNYANNPLAVLLQTTTAKQVMALALHTLERIVVAGNRTVSPFNALCLLHLVYALSLVTYGPAAAAARSSALFAQSLAYSHNFASPDRENYLEVATLIWQPGDMSAAELTERIRSCRPPALQALPACGESLLNSEFCRDDAVVTTARSFLDGSDLESHDVKNSGLSIKHSRHRKEEQTRGVFVASLIGISEELLLHFREPDAIKVHLKAVSQHANNGLLSSVRQLELELLRAGRASLGPSTAFFDNFVPCTRRLCNTAYAAHESLSNQRPAYYDKGIQFMRSVLVADDDFQMTATSKDVMSAAIGLAEPYPSFLAEGSVELLNSAGTRHPVAVTDDRLQADGRKVAAAASEEAAPDVAAAHVASPEFSTPSNTSSEEEEPAKHNLRVVSDDCCKICGHKPTGNPKWFHGSMAKHMSTKHPAEVVFYRCPFPGCKSQFRNRADNLRQHILKKHRRTNENENTEPEHCSNSSNSENFNGSSKETRRGTPSKKRKLR
ncbi:zinc finger protein [Niveomyces insectorum RCEF 264]|uniref:Zinc finger protein n=1 Tax=Niveomyces insectorum RCEF 264 TaxID=1081102 RepID=A0A168A813_9HYPO|nr:zinc finger protein [Niveomyces insectorum RCEF 264]